MGVYYETQPLFCLTFNVSFIDSPFWLSTRGWRGGNSCPDNVAGTYTFITDDIKMTCSNGTKYTFPPSSFRVKVTQNDNWLTLDNLSDPPANITIIDSSNMEGAFESDCDFITTSDALATAEGIPGNLSLHWTIQGTFTKNGWCGEYDYSLFFYHNSLLCKYPTTFHGDRSSSSNLYYEQNSGEFNLDAFDSNEEISFERGIL